MLLREHPIRSTVAIFFVRDPALIPPPESPVDFEIASVNLKSIPSKYRRQIVEFDSFETPGTVIVDPHQRMLYLTLEDGKALRFGVGVGRDGFAWSGEALINMKRVWPRWVPPEEMVLRDDVAAKWANGMPGGPENPLGARALYLFANGEDTLYRIHGTNEPKSIGKAVSSGCIRLPKSRYCRALQPGAAGFESDRALGRKCNRAAPERH